MNGDRLERARRVLAIEAGAIEALRARLGGAFAQAVDLLLACSGKVVVTGIGKAGLVGRKIAATLASTGTTTTFLHAGKRATATRARSPAATSWWRSPTAARRRSWAFCRSCVGSEYR